MDAVVSQLGRGGRPSVSLGMHLFAPEAWRAAPLLLTRSAQLTQPTVRLPQAHSCDSDGLALTGPQSLVLRLV